MQELKAKVDTLVEHFHRLDRDHAVLAASVASLSLSVTNLGGAIKTLTETINQQKGAWALAKWLWACVAGLATVVAGAWIRQRM